MGDLTVFLAGYYTGVLAVGLPALVSMWLRKREGGE